MIRSITFILILFAIIAVHSCKKSTTTSVSVAPLFIPLDMDSLMPGYAVFSYRCGVPYSGVSGVLIAYKISGSLVDTSGQVNIYNRNWEIALFANPTADSLTNAGVVSVNTAPLSNTPYRTNENYYLHNDASGVWNTSSLNRWNITGSGDIPSFSADISGSFPSFTGSLPTTISKTTDFSFTFNSSNTINADSAYVSIYYRGEATRSSVVNGNGGTATIPGHFTGLMDSFITVPYGGSSDGPFYFGKGYVLIVVYNHFIKSIAGKRFAFVKQRVYIGIVNFL